MQEQVKQRTVALWSYTNSQLPLYLNPLYRSGTNYQLVLMPVASMRYIKPWKSLYCRWNPSMRQQVRTRALMIRVKTIIHRDDRRMERFVERVFLYLKDPVYQRTRELLVLKEQLEKQLEEGRREQASRANRAVTSPAPPRTLHSPVHT